MTRGLFVLALAFLAFLYGVMVPFYGLWPHQTLLKARVALDALMQTQQDVMQSHRPRGVKYFDQNGTPHPWVAQFNTSSGNASSAAESLILVSGGPSTYRTDLCPTHGCLAWIMDRQGRVRHTWEVDRSAIWERLHRAGALGRDPADILVGFQYHLYPNGDLLVSFQGHKTYPYGIGMAKVDKDGNILWVRGNLAHHWFSVDERGRILTPGFKPLTLPRQLGDTHLVLNCHQTQMVEDTILMLDPEGRTIWEKSVLELLEASGYIGLVFESKRTRVDYDSLERENVYDHCDPIHLNDVRVLGADLAKEYRDLEPGNLLVSFRNLNAVAVIDPDQNKVKWMEQGRTVLQHSPRFFGKNKVLVFDNQGGPKAYGGSRLVLLSLQGSEPEVLFPRPGVSNTTDFYSFDTGYVDLSEDRSRALVALSREGRVVEVDLEAGKVIWEFTNNHDVTDLVHDLLEGKPEAGQLKADQYIGRVEVHTAHYVPNVNFAMNRDDPTRVRP